MRPNKNEQLIRNDTPGASLFHGICAASLFSAVLNLFQLSLPLYSMQIFDRVLPSDSVPTLVTLSLIIFGITGCSVFVDVSRSIILGRIAERIDRSLHDKAMAAAVEGSSAGLSALKDVESIRLFITGPLAPAILDGPWSIAFLVALFILNPFLGWFTVVASAMMLLIGIASHVATGPRRNHVATMHNSVAALLHNVNQTYDTTATMGMRSRILRHLGVLRRKACYSSMLIGERQAWIEATGRGMRTIVQVGVLAVAAWLVLSSHLQTGAIVASSMLFARALAPAERLGTCFYAIAGFYGACRRAATFAKEGPTSQNLLGLPEITGTIVADDVTLFLPGSSRAVLQKINLTILPGEVVVVVGKEGSGKSSLAKVLAGAMKPTAGSVRIDGFSISDFDHEELGRQIGFSSETPSFLRGSIAEIISRRESPESAKVIRAARMAGIHSVVQALPSGYEMEVEDGSHLLSAGQRQRLALARAFYGSPRLVILDEPTKHLDDSGETMLFAAVRELKEAGSTVVIVSRVSALFHLADKLVMLNEGSLKLAASQTDMQQFIALRLATSQR